MSEPEGLSARSPSLVIHLKVWQALRGSLLLHVNPLLSQDDPLLEEVAAPEADQCSTSSIDGSPPGRSPKSMSIPIPGGGRASLDETSTPGDPLDAATLDKLIQQASTPTETRFHMSEIIRNPSLQKAARRELEGRLSVTDNAEDDHLEGNGHEGEIERQRAVVSDLNRTVVEESKVNKDMAALILERLTAGQRYVAWRSQYASLERCSLKQGTFF
jgi:hypothetical protein